MTKNVISYTSHFITSSFAHPFPSYRNFFSAFSYPCFFRSPPPPLPSFPSPHPSRSRSPLRISPTLLHLHLLPLPNFPSLPYFTTSLFPSFRRPSFRNPGEKLYYFSSLNAGYPVLYWYPSILPNKKSNIFSSSIL